MATMGKLVVFCIFFSSFCHIFSANFVDHSFSIKNKKTDFVLERNRRAEAFLETKSAEKQSVLSRAIEAKLRSRRDVGAVNEDSKCIHEKETFKNAVKDKKKDFATSTSFINETRSSMAVVWAGKNNGRILVAVTEEYFGGFITRPSVLYHSQDDGKTFTNINTKVNKQVIRKANGLLKNTFFPEHVLVVVYTDSAKSDVFITDNGGDDFTGPYHLPFLLEDGVSFHPKDPKYMLAQSISKHELYLSKDGGRNWQLIHNNIYKFAWHDDMDDNRQDRKGTIYVQSSPNLLSGARLNELLRNSDFKLYKTEAYGVTEDSWHLVHDKVFSFQVKGRFLFVSSGQDKFRRYMRVSTDAGKNWNVVQLPTLTTDRFYSIMDMSEEVVFMHVDQPGETGFGTLYVSDTSGVIYSESLSRHLFPNHDEVTDFYKVESMPGVFIASQMMADNSIRTRISFDRGAEWKPIPRPVGAKCKDESKDCNLQIHNMYSLARHIPSQPPLSIPTAPGIILVHGHVAEALQTSYPDVFVSNDGGYTFIESLKGPHHYQIADHGGLLVAVPADTLTPTVVKFSTDEGRCWHEYKFTNETIIFTGLLTEPGGRSMSVSIWGYGATDHVWRITVLNFLTVIPNQCQDSDYQPWTAHLAIHDEEDENFKGCRLGTKVTYKRLKIDSWCHNGYPHEVETKRESCTCRPDDYECDYGYYRPDGSDDCVLDSNFEHVAFDICKGGHVEKLVSKGYRKVAGDTCTGGFQPPPVNEVDMSQRCKDDAKSLVKGELNAQGIIHEEMLDSNNNNTQTPNSGGNGALIAVVVIVLLVAVALLLLAGRRYYLKRKHVTYRYSTLSQSEEFDYDNDFENALVRHATVYEDTSDDDMLTKKNSATNYGTKNGTGSTVPPNPARKVKSYHDDSDVDMLE